MSLWTQTGIIRSAGYALPHDLSEQSFFFRKEAENTEAKALDTYHLVIGQKYEAY